MHVSVSKMGLEMKYSMDKKPPCLKVAFQAKKIKAKFPTPLDEPSAIRLCSSLDCYKC